MKRLLLVVVVAVAGCKKDEPATAPASGSASATASAAAPAPVAVADAAPAPRLGTPPAPDATADERRLLADTAHEGEDAWGERAAKQPCPGSADELAKVMGQDLRDAWGHSLLLLCGNTLPPDASGRFALQSAGPDGKFATADDIHSWDPDPKSEAALQELVQMKDATCACTTAECADKAAETFEDWSKRNADTKGTQRQADKAGKLISDISDCILKMQPGDDAAQPTR